MASMFAKARFTLSTKPTDHEAGEQLPGLLAPKHIRALAEKLYVRPTKKLGQNFVHDANTVRKIVARAQIADSDHVLEVGPGLGSLTLALTDHAAAVTAIEIDPLLADELPETLATWRPGRTNLTVINDDALHVTDVPGEPDLFVANLPYNVSVPVLLHLLDRCPTLRGGLVMVQAEVADRLAAGPGNKTYGVPSAKAAWHAQVKRDLTIPRGVFWPMPNVDSALVAFTVQPPPRDDVTRAEVFAVIDAAFSMRRKTLRSALAKWAGSADQATAVLTAAGIDPTLRGERLSIAEFAAIAAAKTTASE